MAVTIKLGYLLLTFLIPCSIIVIIAATKYGAVPRMIGGHDAPDSKYPYVVLLKVTRAQCSATIIHKRWILCAAHCLRREKTHLNVTAHAGVSKIEDKDEESHVYKSEYVVMHKDFNASDRINDNIGLIRVSKDIEFNDKVKMIQLTKKDPFKICDSATGIGWGGPTGNLTDVSDKLQVITVKIACQLVCEKKLKIKLNKSHICTSTSKYKKGVCPGDSGSPLVIGGVQIGIAINIGECILGQPNIYVRVCAYLDWIKAEQAKFGD